MKASEAGENLSALKWRQGVEGTQGDRQVLWIALGSVQGIGESLASRAEDKAGDGAQGSQPRQALGVGDVEPPGAELVAGSDHRAASQFGIPIGAWGRRRAVTRSNRMASAVMARTGPPITRIRAPQ